MTNGTDFFGLVNFFDELKADVDEQIALLTERHGRVEQEVTDAGIYHLDIESFAPTIHQLSSLTAIDVLRNNIVRRFVAITDAALQQSIEFDYPDFREPLVNAIINSSVGGGGAVDYILIPSDAGSGVTVEINMDGLGPPEIWGDAIKRARSVLGVGDMPEPAASKIWAEKIYGVDREGRRIVHPRTEEDITERYAGKYIRTIETRMAFIPAGMAPWWYILEHGSRATNLDTKSDEGEPYPVVPPTRFVSRFEAEVAATYTQIYRRVRSALETSFRDMISALRRARERMFEEQDRLERVASQETIEQEGIRGITPRFRQLALEAGVELADIYLQATNFGRRREIPINVELGQFRDRVGNLYSVYRTSNDIFGIRYSSRNPTTGRFGR